VSSRKPKHRDATVTDSFARVSYGSVMG
jgi:hypothetical protein